MFNWSGTCKPKGGNRSASLSVKAASAEQAHEALKKKGALHFFNEERRHSDIAVHPLTNMGMVV